MICYTQMPYTTSPLTLAIFGITGNLAQIKLIPVLYDMEEKGVVPENMSIIGVARKPMTKEEFQEYFYQTLHLENIHHRHEIKEEVFKRLCQKIHYLSGNADDPKLYHNLKEYLSELTHKEIKNENRIYYLATYPQLYGAIFDNLQIALISLFIRSIHFCLFC